MMTIGSSSSSSLSSSLSESSSWIVRAIFESFGDEDSFMSSSKRDGKRRADAPATQMPVDEDGEELEYEDEYGDEFEEEIIAGGEEGEEGEEGMEISASEMLGSDGVHA